MSEFTFPTGADPITSSGLRESEVRRIMEERVTAWVGRKQSRRRWIDWTEKQAAAVPHVVSTE